MYNNEPSKRNNMVIGIKGAGDIASGIACRLHRCGFKVIMTETAVPTTVRRTVAFSGAVYYGEEQVEGIISVLCHNINDINTAISLNKIAVIVNENGDIFTQIKPIAIIDAILAKRNIGTYITDAPCVIGIGPGFTASVDCHAVIETQRGHNLGRVIYEGSVAANTGVPGDIGGYTLERLLRGSANGEFEPLCEIGDMVKANDAVAMCGGVPLFAQIDGIVRGLLHKGVMVSQGMKCGDIDPRCKIEHCYTVSDKALAVAGGALEAIMHFGNVL